MDNCARAVLGKLLLAAERSKAGVRSSPPALTKSHLAEYQSMTSLVAKESFDTTLKAARAAGAVALIWERGLGEEGFIQRVNLIDLEKLATFLGAETVEGQVREAADALAPYLEGFPVLKEVLGMWATLRRVRGQGPKDTQEWVDAARVIQHIGSNDVERSVDEPIRELSARLFKDSKRIEKLTVPLDVLLVGDCKAEPRPPAEVWQELGLFREEQPVRLAGKVEVSRTRVTGLLDAPYSAFSPPSVLKIATIPKMVLTIENLTTFHSEARRRCDEECLLIYTAGMPTPAWRAMYLRLIKTLPTDVPIMHWGDVDEGGFRIAATVVQDARTAGHRLVPWRMHPNDVPEAQRVEATPHTLARMRHFAEAAGWGELAKTIEEAGFITEQEGFS